MFHFAPSLRLEKSHYVNYNIARCSIKWCENTNNRYIIIFNYMQWFYYSICQSTWCQNASKLIYQKGEISFLWDTKNVVYRKFDFHAWRWTGRWQKSSGLENRPTPGMVFPKQPVFHFAPVFHLAPTYYNSANFVCTVYAIMIFFSNIGHIWPLDVMMFWHFSQLNNSRRG